MNRRISMHEFTSTFLTNKRTCFDYGYMGQKQILCLFKFWNNSANYLLYFYHSGL